MATKIAIFETHQDPSTDQPSFRSKSYAANLKRSGQAVEVGPHAIQRIHAAGAQRKPVVQTPEQVRRDNYNAAVKLPPIGYQADRAGPLMFGQMWEKRASLGFEILQLCPPHRKPEVTEATA
jgi:hypothetical protein